jgi:DNA-binding NtrC family response regulator
LFESELFGHEPGAHTDAVARRTGRVEAAQGGTLFLDGIETLTAPLQAKLLRVVQERSFERLGGTDLVQVDVRFIASAGAGLEADARAGRFRGDLFYRLNVVRLDLPPLRERVEDVAALASYFLKLHSVRYGATRGRLTTAARRRLKAHTWPGNVRELGNVIERAIITTGGGTLGPETLTLAHGSPAEEAVRQGLEARWSLEALELAYIKEVLKQARGNKSRAAAILGINRKTLLQKLKKAKA